MLNLPTIAPERAVMMVLAATAVGAIALRRVVGHDRSSAASAENITAPLLRTLDASHGAVLLFRPGSCLLSASFVARLNALDTLPGSRVVGVSLDVGDDAETLDRIAADFGLRFPLERATAPLLREIGALAAVGGGEQPVLVVVRFGEVVAVERLRPDRQTAILLPNEGVRQ